MSAIEPDASQQKEATEKRKREALSSVDGDNDDDDDEQQRPPPKKKKPVLVRMCCMVCLREQGDPGVVPCVLSRCRPIAHIICLACCVTIQTEKRETTVKCPICTMDGEVVPISSAVDETTDDEARRLINQVKFRGNPAIVTTASTSTRPVASTTQTARRVQVRRPHDDSDDSGDGLEDVRCNCGRKAMRLQVKKKNANEGRWFWICRLPRDDVYKCNFFKWDDE